MGIIYLFILSNRWRRQREPGLSQKTFLRSKLEMLKLLKHLKIAEPLLKPPERLPELLHMLTLRNTTTSTKLLMLLSSNPRETPKLLDPSLLKVNQKLLLLSELEVSENLPQSQRRSFNSSD